MSHGALLPVLCKRHDNALKRELGGGARFSECFSTRDDALMNLRRSSDLIPASASTRTDSGLPTLVAPREAFGWTGPPPLLFEKIGLAPAGRYVWRRSVIFFDGLVMGQIVPVNPAASVRGPSHVARSGKTPVLAPAESRRLPSPTTAPRRPKVQIWTCSLVYLPRSRGLHQRIDYRGAVPRTSRRPNLAAVWKAEPTPSAAPFQTLSED